MPSIADALDPAVRLNFAKMAIAILEMDEHPNSPDSIAIGISVTGEHQVNLTDPAGDLQPQLAANVGITGLL